MTSKINLFILGLPKAGTTSLYDFLTSQEEVGGLPDKECHCFNPRYGDLGLKQLFIPLNKLYVVDASVSYVYNIEILQAILDYNPKAKFIFIHREFISRAKSHYLMDVNKYGLEDKGLKWYWDNKELFTFYGNPGFGPIDSGCYSKFYGKMLSVLDSKNILEIHFEDMINNWHGTREIMSEFLGLKLEGDLPKSNEGVILTNVLVKSLVKMLSPQIKSSFKKSIFVKLFAVNSTRIHFKKEDINLLEELKVKELKFLNEAQQNI